MASTNQSSLWHKHAIFEKNSIILVIGIVVAIVWGGLVEIVPLFYLKSTIEKVEGVRPYSPLELAGYNIYIREGCYNCHSQMVRPLRDEVERYGHYSLAAESMYDHPFQWGSKRTGPDLARVGGKYSDDWHRDHMRNPRAVVPTSIMPSYPWLETTPLDGSHLGDQMKVLSIVGVPYSQEMIDKAEADLVAQGAGEGKAATDMQKRYSKAIVRDLGADKDKSKITELDAVVAYLQRLGTQVDFKLYNDKANIR